MSTRFACFTPRSQLPTLENLLNVLNAVCSFSITDVWLTETQNCGIEKSFLFDVISKIYVATDR